MRERERERERESLRERKRERERESVAPCFLLLERALPSALLF